MKNFFATLLVGLAVAIFAGPADAAVVIEYDDGPVAFDGSSLGASTTIDLAAWLTESGDTTQFANAQVDLNAALTSSNQTIIGGQLISTQMTFAGTLGFTAAGGDSIVEIDFSNASLMLPEGASSAALTWSSDAMSLPPTGGPALAAALTDLPLALPASFGFTFSQMTPTSPEGELSDGFTANSDFSGQMAVVPEPTSLVVVAVTSALLLRRRRRA